MHGSILYIICCEFNQQLCDTNCRYSRTHKIVVIPQNVYSTLHYLVSIIETLEHFRCVQILSITAQGNKSEAFVNESNAAYEFTNFECRLKTQCCKYSVFDRSIVEIFKSTYNYSFSETKNKIFK